MRESAIEKKVCDYARRNGCLVLKLAGPNQKGQPDRVFLKNGRVLFIEFKAQGKRPTALQEKWLKDLHWQGFAAICVDSAEKGFAELERYGL